MTIFHLRMLLAARRQILRDMSHQMSEDEVNKLLDQIVVLTKLIEELENKK